MRNRFLVFAVVAMLSSCAYVTKKEAKPVQKPYSEMTPEEKARQERINRLKDKLKISSLSPQQN